MPNSVEAVWKTIKEIKLDDIRKATLLPLKVALIGTEDELVWLQNHLQVGAKDDGDRRRLMNAIRLFEIPVGAEAVAQAQECTFACISPAAAEQLAHDALKLTNPVYTVGTEGEWNHFKRELLDTRWDLHLALGRNLPGLRSELLEYLVTNIACVNAEVAVVTAVAAKIPGIGPIYPGVAFGDTIVITKNQVMMAFRLAGACGLSVDIVHRKAEVLSIIFGGLGWRTIAREVVGIIPSPAAIALKGAIAYAGTYVVGKAIAHFFVTGEQLGRPDQKRLYLRSMEAGKRFVKERIGRWIPRPGRYRRRSNRERALRKDGAESHVIALSEDEEHASELHPTGSQTYRRSEPDGAAR